MKIKVDIRIGNDEKITDFLDGKDGVIVTSKWAGTETDYDDPLHNQGVSCKKSSGLVAGAIIQVPNGANHLAKELMDYIEERLKPYINKP